MKAWMDALGPLLISGTGIVLIFLASLVAKWRNHRAARRCGGRVVSLAPTSYAPHVPPSSIVKTHRR